MGDCGMSSRRKGRGMGSAMGGRGMGSRKGGMGGGGMGGRSRAFLPQARRPSDFTSDHQCLMASAFRRHQGRFFVCLGSMVDGRRLVRVHWGGNGESQRKFSSLTE